MGRQTASNGGHDLFFGLYLLMSHTEGTTLLCQYICVNNWFTLSLAPQPPLPHTPHPPAHLPPVD